MSIVKITIKSVAGIIMGGFLLWRPGLAVAVPVAAPHPAAAGHNAAVHFHAVRNPHLHGANNERAEKDARELHSHSKGDEKEHAEHDVDGHGHRRHWVHLFHHRWDYANWVTLHRGLGTVHGTVTDGAGHGITAKVWLRSRRNRPLHRVSSKHITYSRGDGAFVMHGVRTGTYHVRAGSGHAARSSSLIAVHPGVTSSATVRL